MNPLVNAIDANLRALRLQEENERLRAALKQVEWSGFACPSCFAPEEYGHKTDCALQEALRPDAERPVESEKNND